MYQNEYRGKQTTDSTETMFSIVPLGACTYRHMSDDDVFHLNVNRLEKGLVSREYPVFYASDDNNLDFIVQQINSSAEFRSFCAEQKKGGTRTRLYYKNLCEFQMLIPNTEEQEKIATFLLTLDTLITLHQRKYIHYLLYHFSTKNAIIFDEFFLLPIPFYHISRSEFAQLQKIPGKFRGFLIIQIFLHTSPTCGNRQYSSFFRECGESS